MAKCLDVAKYRVSQFRSCIDHSCDGPTSKCFHETFISVRSTSHTWPFQNKWKQWDVFFSPAGEWAKTRKTSVWSSNRKYVSVRQRGRFKTWLVWECGGLISGSMQHADGPTAKQRGFTYCWTAPNTSAQVSPQLQERREAPKDRIHTSQTDRPNTNTDRDRGFLSNRSPSRGALTFWKNSNSTWLKSDFQICRGLLRSPIIPAARKSGKVTIKRGKIQRGLMSLYVGKRRVYIKGTLCRKETMYTLISVWCVFTCRDSDLCLYFAVSGQGVWSLQPITALRWGQDFIKS